MENKHCLIIAQEITELLRINNFLRSTALISETLAMVRDCEKLIESVEKILSDYSAKISEKPDGICFPISYGDKNYGDLCVQYAGEDEKAKEKLFQQVDRIGRIMKNLTFLGSTRKN